MSKLGGIERFSGLDKSAQRMVQVDYECNRLLNEVAGATDATREAGGRSCRESERLR